MTQAKQRGNTAQIIGLTYDELIALSPCVERCEDSSSASWREEKWNGKKISATQAQRAGIKYDDLRWVALARAKNDPIVARRVRLWIADCAERVLPLFEQKYPNDKRPRRR